MARWKAIIDEKKTLSRFVKRSILCYTLAPCVVSMCQAQNVQPIQPAAPLQREQQSVSYLPLHPPTTGEGRGMLGTEGYDFYPRVAAGFIYNDNINLNRGKKFGDVMGVLSPGATFVLGETTGAGFGAANIQGPALTLEAGSSAVGSRALVGTSRGLSLDYAAGFNFYAAHAALNSIDHSARFNAIYPWPRLTLRFEQNVEVLSETAIDAASRQRNQTFATLVDGSYSFSELTSFQATLSQAISEVEGGLARKNWQGGGSVNYVTTPSLSTGLGFSVGLQDAERSPTQVYEQARLRSGYLVTELIHIDGSVGLEWRQFSGSRKITFSPVFDLGGTYSPGQRTQFTLSAGRSTQSSTVLAGQNYTTTSVNFGFRQEISYRISGSLGVSYNHLSYSATGAGSAIPRADDFMSFRAGLAMALSPHASTGLFYRFRNNTSTQSVFAYSNNQVGISLSLAY